MNRLFGGFKRTGDPIHNVTVLWLEPAPPGSAARTHLDGTLARLEIEKVPVTKLIYSSVQSRKMLPKIYRLLRLSLQAVFAPNKSVLICRWHPLLVLATPIWRAMGGRVLLLVQGNDETMYESYTWMRMIPGSGRMVIRSISECDSILVLNDGLKSWIRDLADIRSNIQIPIPKVMSTGVSDVFLRTTASLQIEDPYVLFFGNLAKWQGVETLLAAVEDQNWPPSLRVLIIGDGEDYTLVQQATSKRIVALGRRVPEEVAQKVAGAYATICPKLDFASMSATTTPFKILESVAVGVPVIASDIPAQRAMIETGGYGICFRVGDESELALAVSRVFNETSLRKELAENARLKKETLSWGYEAPKLGDAVRELF